MIAPTPPLKTVNAMPAPNNKALTVSIQLLFDPQKTSYFPTFTFKIKILPSHALLGLARKRKGLSVVYLFRKRERERVIF